MVDLHGRYRFPISFLCPVFFGSMIGRNVIGRPIINDVLLSNVVPSISQAAIRLVPGIGVEVVDLVVDPRRNGVVERLVVDVVFVISTRIQPAGRVPMVLVLALVYTDHRRVIWFTCPLLGLIHVRPFRRTAAAGGQSKRATDPSISIVSIVPGISMMHPWIVVMLGRVGRILRLRAGCSDARRFGVVTARATGPEWFGAVVKVIRRGSLHYQVENRGASHHLDGSLEWKIGEPLAVAPNYNVAGF